MCPTDFLGFNRLPNFSNEQISIVEFHQQKRKFHLPSGVEPERFVSRHFRRNLRQTVHLRPGDVFVFSRDEIFQMLLGGPPAGRKRGYYAIYRVEFVALERGAGAHKYTVISRTWTKFSWARWRAARRKGAKNKPGVS